MGWTSQGSAADHRLTTHDRAGELMCPRSDFEMTALVRFCPSLADADGSVRNARLSRPSTIGITRRARFDKIEVTTHSSGHATMVAGVGDACSEIKARRWT